jgi:hypothetical protein
MAIPTSGVTGATAYSPTSVWNAEITLIGDSENLIGENINSETATLNRPTRELAQNAKYLRDLFTFADTVVGVVSPATSTEDFYYRIQEYQRRMLRYKLTFTLAENLTLNASYDEIFPFYNLISFDEIIIDLNSKIISVESGFSVAGSTLFDFNYCTCNKLTLKDGTITDTTGNLNFGISFDSCIGNFIVDNVDSSYTPSTTHVNYNGSKGIVKNCVFTGGGNGISVNNCGFILSQDNGSGVTGPSVYGLVANTGGTIRKFDATQPTGGTADESETAGGVIE